MEQISRIGGALAIGLLAFAFPVSGAPVQEPAASNSDVACSSGGGSLPASIRLPGEIVTSVETMLRRSPTFRAQCRRLADAPWMHVLVRLRVDLDDRAFRARSTIMRPQPRLILAMIDLTALAEPTMWLSHEFEHLIEQIDGVDVAKLVEDRDHAWAVGEGMFETTRAIRAGEAVFKEVHGKRDNFVD